MAETTTTPARGRYDTNFLKGVLDQGNEYTYGYGKEKTYDFPTGTPTSNAGNTQGTKPLLANTDPGVYDPTNKLWGNYGFKTNTADREALKSGDYSKISNPDALSNDALHFLYKKGGVMNLYGVNEFLRLRGDKNRAYSSAEAEQLLAPYIATRKQKGLGGALGGILGTVLPIAASFIPGVGPLISAGLSTAIAVANKNPLGIISGLAGIPGVGSGITGSLGSILGGSLGVTADGLQVGKAYLTGGGTKYLTGGGLDRIRLAEGGKVKGPGDGMSDGVSATINGDTPAALSDGEHVVPALQVAMLGRGSSDAGSDKLKALVLKEIEKMYGTEIDPVKLQKKAMKAKEK